MTPHPDADELQAFAVDDTYWVVWCCFCRKWHWHGAGAGHRTAHCHNRASPYDRHGYTLIGGDPMPAWVKRDIKRKKPVGRASV